MINFKLEITDSDDQKEVDLSSIYMNLCTVPVDSEGRFPTLLAFRHSQLSGSVHFISGVKNFSNKIARALACEETRTVLSVSENYKEQQLHAILVLCYIFSTHSDVLSLDLSRGCTFIINRDNAIEIKDSEGQTVSLGNMLAYPNQQLMDKSFSLIKAAMKGAGFFLGLAVGSVLVLLFTLALANFFSTGSFSISASLLEAVFKVGLPTTASFTLLLGMFKGYDDEREARKSFEEACLYFKRDCLEFQKLSLLAETATRSQPFEVVASQRHTDPNETTHLLLANEGSGEGDANSSLSYYQACTPTT